MRAAMHIVSASDVASGETRELRHSRKSRAAMTSTMTSTTRTGVRVSAEERRVVVVIVSLPVIVVVVGTPDFGCAHRLINQRRDSTMSRSLLR